MIRFSNRYAQCQKWFENVWYKDQFIGMWLMPLGFLFADVVRFRKFLYRLGLLKSTRLPVPVIIIGNITVGGTGKTPLIIWIAHWLKTLGYNPGIISRGYGGQATSWPQSVTANSSPTLVGDEALLLAKQTGCPVVVSPQRVEAALQLLRENPCNILLSDDGLQHYALRRDIEIAVVDGERRFGNGYCLPAGPLREPISRLQSVDLIIVNGEKYEDNEYAMQLIGKTAINLVTGEQRSLSQFSDRPCHALAGIGHPQRFFKHLAVQGIVSSNQSFPDHYAFRHDDIVFDDDQPVLMTEKDAVKCAAFASKQHWYVPITASPELGFTEHLQRLVNKYNTSNTYSVFNR